MHLLVIRAHSRKSAVGLFGKLLNETAVPRIRANVRRSPGAADRPARPAQITHTKARRAHIVSGGVFLFGEANYYQYRPKNYTTSGSTRDGLIFVSDQKITSKGFSTSVGIGYVLPRSLTRK